MLDTNVVSDGYRAYIRGDTYSAHLDSPSSLISFQTIEEILYGIRRRRWGALRTAKIESYLRRFRVIYPNSEVVRACAQLRVDRDRIGDPIDTADAWIAATAIVLGCPLVTTDDGFRRTRVPGLTVWGIG